MGLTAVPTAALRTMLRGLHRGTLPFPLTIVGLTSHGLQDVAGPILAHMRELNAEGTRAVVVAVIAERTEHARELARIDTDH